LSLNAVWGGLVAVVVMGALSLGFALRQLRKLSN
jgi:hypothetical protein